MRTRIAFVFLALMASILPSNAVWAGQAPARRSIPRGIDMVRDYRISHYLELAVEFQALPPRERAARLRALATDASRSSEIFPLCRMLFEAKDGGVFRRPMIGGPAFLIGGFHEWPLEPITLFEGVPILIVRGYSLGGLPESAARYVAYCLANCQWSERTYAVATSARLQQIIGRFIESNPALGAHADWLRLQAM